jgi:Xaa-Pro aminopeptidase
MWRLVVAVVLLAGIPENAWVPAEITPGHAPTRIVVTKTGWRSGSAALIVNDPHRVERLYRLLAGNERVGFTCGFHWNVRFDYRDRAAESIDINEDCEEFRRDPKVTWRELSAVLSEARRHPSHYVIEVRPTGARESLRAKLTPFGSIIDGNPLLLASRAPWSASRVEKLRRAAAGLARIEVIPEADSGN